MLNVFNVPLPGLTCRRPGFFIFLIIFLGTAATLAADKVTVGQLRDAVTREPIRDALVVVDSQYQTVTDDEGLFVIPAETVYPCSLAAQHVGYEKHHDQIEDRGSFIITMRPKVIAGEPLIVSANRLPMSARDIAASQTVLTQADPLLSNSRHLGELSAGLGGMSIRAYGGLTGLHSLSLRGGMAYHNLILLDGQRISSEQNGQLDASLIPLDMIGQVEVYKSGNSAVFGADAMTGVINLATRPSSRTCYRFSAETGSFGRQRFSAILSQPAGQIGQVGLILNDERLDGDFHFDYQGQRLARQNADSRRQSFLLTLATPGGKAGQLKLRLLGIDSEVGVPGATVSEVQGLARQNDDNFYAAASYHRQFAPDLLWETTVGWQRARQYYRDPALVWEGQMLESRYTTESGEIRSEWRYTGLNNHQLSVGYEFHNGNVASPDLVDSDRQQHSGYILDIIRISTLPFVAAAILQPALRWDHYSDFGTQWSPRIGAVVKFDSPVETDIFANWGHNFRAPTFNDLHWLYGGNPDLNPEKGTHFEIGSRWYSQLKNVQTEWHLAYFRNRISDLIQWAPVDEWLWMPMNLDDVDIDGWETNLKLKTLADRINLRVNYSYTRSVQDVSDPRLDGRQLIYVPRHTGGIDVSGRWRNSAAYVAIQYVGSRFYTADNSVELAGYELVNTGWSYDFELFAAETQISGQILNLFDQDHQSVVDYPMPGREFRVKLAVSWP